MKKMKYFFFALVALVAAACSKDEAGGTATQSMAGQWYVTVDAVDKDGNVKIDDPYAMGKILVLTYNTAGNSADSIWVSDLGNFWPFCVKAGCDQGSMTFATKDSVPSSYTVNNTVYTCNACIAGGKIMPGAAKTPHGAAADSIVFYVSFDDDTNPADYGFHNYKVSGYRYTGFTEDD